MPSIIEKYWRQLPSPLALVIRHLLSIAIGVTAAFVIFYVLYRVGLPSKPFIYVAF